MKTKFKTILKAGVIAAAMAVSGASHAINLGSADTVDFSNDGISFFGEQFGFSTTVWTVQGYGAHDVTAFCIDPLTGGTGAASYAATSFAPSADVVKLYESSYNSQVMAGGHYNSNAGASFQLALWELYNDNGNLGTGNLIVPTSGGDLPGNDAIAQAAATMLTNAHSYTGAMNDFQFVKFTAVGSPNSQSVMSAFATPVPEADSWAMLAAGLGVLGLVGRRKQQRSEKFA
jgi:hypothetical protein